MIKKIVKTLVVDPARNAVFRAMGLDRDEVLQKLKEQYQKQQTFEDWFFGWITRQNTYAKEFSPRNVYFEFGVGGGDSMVTFINAAKKFCVAHRCPLTDFKIYGFDSFRGLPAREEGDEHLNWHAGLMSVSRRVVESKIERTGFPLSNVHLIEGYYKDSLTSELMGELKGDKISPSIVTIDVDYYSSTKTAIDWLLPILKSGCVFYFDDFWSFHGHPRMGELRYISEFNEGVNGYLRPCHIYGLEHQSFIYSSREWEWKVADLEGRVDVCR